MGSIAFTRLQQQLDLIDPPLGSLAGTSKFHEILAILFDHNGYMYRDSTWYPALGPNTPPRDLNNTAGLSKNIINCAEELRTVEPRALLQKLSYAAEQGHADQPFFMFLDRIAMIKNKSIKEPDFKAAIDLIWDKLRGALELIRHDDGICVALLNLRKAVYILNELRWDAVKT